MLGVAIPTSIRRSVLLVLAVALATIGLQPISASAANPAPGVVPRLQEWTGGIGTFALTSASRIVVDSQLANDTTSGVSDLFSSDRTLLQVASRLHDDLETTSGLDLAVVTGASASTGDIFLTLAADSGLGTEGYELAVSSSSVTVAAPATDGVFYGGQTVLQVLRQSLDGKTLPIGTARDWPDLSYRAEHFDVSRRFMTVAEIQDEIRRAAWNKLNVVQLMFNQANAFRLYSSSYADAAPTDPDYRYDQADIAAIEAVAAEYHVTVVPEIQNPTKMQPIATIGGIDRSLDAQCGDPATLDFTDAGVVAWAQDLIAHFGDWFEGPYIHLGNDEVPGALANCPYIQNQLDPGESLAERQTVYIDALETTVDGLGKKSMIWVNNTEIRPSLDVLIMNFGSTSVSDTMRDLGYAVVESAYLTGPYDRFYIAPSDYEGKVVPRGDIYDWTPVSDARNVGQVLAMWGDDLFFSETDYFIEMFDGRRGELADRTWNSSPTSATFAEFSTLQDAIGRAPGTPAPAPVPETGNGEPIHVYEFDETYVPSAGTHYPGYWQLSLQDAVGDLHGNGWLFGPLWPSDGISGHGLGFTSQSSSQSLNLGGHRLTSPWTLATWIRRDANGTNTVLLRDMDYAVKVEQSGTFDQVGISTYGGTDHAFDYTLPLGEWTHVVLSSDGADTKLYVDGQLEDTISATIPLPLGGIGGRRPFGGTMDSLKIWAEELDGTEISAEYDSDATDLAEGKVATASSTNVVGRGPDKAVDGDSSTRWGSEYSDPQWIQVDLGGTAEVTGVRLNWEVAYGQAYEIQVSDDAQSWTTVYSTSSGDGGVDELWGLSGQGRYVRMYGTQRGTPYSYSLWDFEIYGAP